ncbi:hypothetical protein KEM54_004905 [Ascosphaera aggregata]|nr:hypothetical protein KEM54_004905 [Ascosphaera aggregata]
MAPMTEEDMEWFKSTFHPIPRPQLPDDCMQYSLYWVSKTTRNTADERAELAEVQKAATELVKTHLQNYIWQREPFKLEFVREDGVTLLRGQTEYGDSIEDEWVITYLLRELTRRFNELWVRVTDSDGEFLLVEAAATLPEWLEPDIAVNRIWIHKGELIIIKPDSHKRHITEKLSFQDARKVILDEPKRLMHSPTIEEEAFYRLRNYPKQISQNMHTARIRLPRRIAWLLHIKPAFISPAVEAFYLRDPISLKPLQAKNANNLTFQADDFVTVSVKFSRVGYAQLKSQDFAVPTVWAGKLPSPDNQTVFASAETGMKVSCGFEMLVSDPQNQDKQFVREIKMLLEDLEAGDEHLPTDEEIDAEWSKAEDDEKWLDISFEDLDSELKGKNRPGRGAAGDFGDASAQENLRRIVAQFEKFLNNDTAGFEGADFIDNYDLDEDTDGDSDWSDEGEDKELSFDEEAFDRAMKEMMGMPSHDSAHRVKSYNKIEEINPGDSGDEDPSPEEIEKLSKQFEAELSTTGVLNHSGTRAGKNKGKGRSVKGKEAADPEDVANSVDVKDIDDNPKINLARNLLESFQSQAGAAGPSTNLMGLMGVKMPKDDRHV